MGRIQTFEDLHCLVTGASAGIGRDIARRLAAAKAKVTITARRADRLEALAEDLKAAGAGAVHVVVLDLADPEAPEALVRAATEAQGPVDVLVNNAGFSVPGFFHKASLERMRAMVQVNVVAAMSLARLVLPGMLARGRGGILNVASMAGYQAAPYQSGYAGTKAFLRNFSDSLHQEVKGTQVVVTALNPGVTDTEFFEAAGYPDTAAFLKHRMPSDKVARLGLRAFQKGKMEVVPGAANKLMIASQRLFTRRFIAGVSRRLMGSRPPPKPRSGA